MTNEEKEVFELILLRKKLLIQLFNFVSLLYKAKSLLKRITSRIPRPEPKEYRNSKKHSKGRNRLDHSTSIPKARDCSESQFLKINLEPVNRHSSVNEGSALINENNLIEKAESSENESKKAPKAEVDVNSGKHSSHI